VQDAADVSTAGEVGPPSADGSSTQPDATTVGTLDASVPADDGRVSNEPPCNTATEIVFESPPTDCELSSSVYTKQ
jgi:hypothetical protein